jgi:hypothetical protein
VRYDRARADECPLADRYAAQDDRPRADGCAAADTSRNHFPIGLRLQLSCVGRGPWIAVVREADVMPDEAFVFDFDSLANERMRADFAACADLRILLNLDEDGDLRSFTDFAPIKIDELRVNDLHAVGKSDIFGNWHLIERSIEFGIIESARSAGGGMICAIKSRVNATVLPFRNTI